MSVLADVHSNGSVSRSGADSPSTLLAPRTREKWGTPDFILLRAGLMLNPEWRGQQTERQSDGQENDFQNAVDRDA